MEEHKPEIDVLMPCPRPPDPLSFACHGRPHLIEQSLKNHMDQPA
jgi:hypothetical protein